MPFFILPPLEFVADNKEIPAQMRQQAQDYQKTLLQQLNVGAEVLKITTGSYVGTTIYQWDQKFTGILTSKFYFSKGASFKQEIARSATLLKQDDCSHLSSIWSIGNKNAFPFPIQNSPSSLQEGLQRTLKNVSPIKIDLTAESLDKRFWKIFQTVLSQQFSSQNIPLLTSEGRFYCKMPNQKNVKLDQVSEYPARPHRLIELTVTKKSLEKNILKIDSIVQMNSGVFGQKKIETVEKQSNIDFVPESFSQNLVNKVIPQLDDLTQAEFKIIRRFGSWVYLNRGRAFGLNIGMRLVGPGNSKLHVIRYAPYYEGEFDVCVAFIRHESKDVPLAEGQLLKLDQTIYPK